MAARFVIGRAGSGKTTWCVERTVAACRADPMGDPILWLVPRQATFQMERDLCCARGLAGFFRIRVMSLEELGQQVLAEVGGSAVPEVTDLGRRMILGSILRKSGSSLEFFGSVARKPGLVGELNNTLAELERSGTDILALCENIGDQRSANQGLVSKLKDLENIYRAYSAFLGSDRLDPTLQLLEALAAVKHSGLLRRATVYVDGYYDFTDYEAKMLAGIARVCQSVHVALTMDGQSPLLRSAHNIPDELSLCHRTEEAYRKLWITLSAEKVKIEAPLILETPQRFKNVGLMAIERWEGAGGGGNGDGVRFIETPDKRSEVDAAARAIADMVASGMRYREIAVLARDLDEYHDLISASFVEHGIPFFADRRRTAAHHPLIQFIRAAVAAAKSDWARDEMMSLVKSGLAGLSHDQSDELENFVLQHGIYGSRWIAEEAWKGRHPSVDDEVAIPAADSADRLRRIVAGKLRPYIEKERGRKIESVRRRTVDLFGLLEAFEVRKTLAGWIGEAEKSGRLEEADEHRQVWANMVDLLQQLVDVLGDEAATLDEFQGMLEAALETFDLALTPPTVDQVLVGPVDRTRTPALKGTIVLGLNENQFPRGARRETVFSDADRRSLRAKKIEVDPESKRRALDESFLGYLAFTRSSERLVLIRHGFDGEAKAVAPGSLWRLARSLAADAPVTVIPPHGRPSAETIATPRQLVTNLMRWVRSGKNTEGEGGEVWPALYQWLAGHECNDDAVDRMRRRAWRALSYRNEAMLSAETAGRLFPTPLRMGVWQIETEAACPFQHFARYGLGLKERGEQRVDGRDLSRIYRDLLNGILGELLKLRKDWRGLEEEEIRNLIEGEIRRMEDMKREELMLSSARNEYLIGRIARTLVLVLQAQRAAAERGGFVPKIGRKTTTLKVVTPTGKEAHLTGRVDRIDSAKSGEAVILDYRLGTARFSVANAYHGISLGLMAAMAGIQDEGMKPAGAFHVQMVRKLRDGDPTKEDEEKNLDLRVKPRGIFDGRIAGLLDSQLAPGGMSEVIAAYVMKGDGKFGNIEKTDVATTQQLSGFLKYVRRKMGELVDDIAGGNIAIRPYRMGTASPCSRCAYRDVCRFETAENRYQILPETGRSEILDEVAE